MSSRCNVRGNRVMCYCIAMCCVGSGTFFLFFLSFLFLFLDKFLIGSRSERIDDYIWNTGCVEAVLNTANGSYVLPVQAHSSSGSVMETSFFFLAGPQRDIGGIPLPSRMTRTRLAE